MLSTDRDRRPVDPVVRAMLVVLAAARIVAVLTGRPQTYPDSPGYRAGFLDFHLVSLTGRAIRPWGVTAWMALWPSDRVLALANAALSAAAWVWLVTVCVRSVRSVAAQRLLAGALLVLALAPGVMSWDLVVLSESVAVPTGIGALAAVLSYAQRPSPRRAVVAVLLAAAFALTRPTTFVFALAWAALLAVLALRTRRWRPHLAAALALVVVAGYALLVGARSDTTWRTADHPFSRTTTVYAYAVSTLDPVARHVIHDLRTTSAPPCMIPDTPAEVMVGGPVGWATRTQQACPDMDAWATAHWNGWWTSWLVAHPGAALRITSRSLPGALHPPVYAGVAAPVPEALASTVLGSDESVQRYGPTYRTEPIILWLLGAVGASALLVRRRRYALVDAVAGVTLAASATAVVLGTLLLQASPRESGRQAVPAVAIATACAFFLLARGAGALTPDEGARPAPDS